MDMNFHYYAVRVIAEKAGFNSDDAQIIAQFSQYVDDFTFSSAFNVESVPQIAQKMYMDGKFHPVKTGITSMKSLLEDEQRSVVMPFHFIPPTPITVENHTYVTVPAHFQDGSLISRMLDGIITQAVWKGVPFSPMLLGIVMHVFADTWAHQSFNAYHVDANKGWVQTAEVILPYAIKPKTFGIYEDLPAIGHAKFGTAPDESALRYTSYKQDATGSINPVPRRYNTEVFCDCAMEMFRALYHAKSFGRAAPTVQEMQDLRAILYIGFAIDEHKDNNILSAHWKGICPNIIFNYNAADITRNIFHFNESKLPENISKEKAYELLGMGNGSEGENDINAVDREQFLASDAFKPTLMFYYYNRCAYDMRDEILI